MVSPSFNRFNVTFQAETSSRRCRNLNGKRPFLRAHHLLPSRALTEPFGPGIGAHAVGDNAEKDGTNHGHGDRAAVWHVGVYHNDPEHNACKPPGAKPTHKKLSLATSIRARCQPPPSPAFPVARVKNTNRIGTRIPSFKPLSTFRRCQQGYQQGQF